MVSVQNLQSARETIMAPRKVNMFLAGYIAALVLLAVLGYFAGDYTARMSEKRQAEIASQHFASDVSYIDLPSVNMSLSSSEGDTGRIRIDMSIEVEKKYLSRIQDYQPLIADRLVNYMRNIPANEVRRANAVPKLRKNLLKEVNSVSRMPVMDIIFRQFVIM